MKTIPENLQQHLSGELTTLTFCWKITLSDDSNLCFTSHDEDIIFDGLTYISKTGFTADGYKTSLKEPTAFEIDGILDSENLNEDDIASGKFDGAILEIFMVNYKASADGRILIKKGKIAKITKIDDNYIFAIAGLEAELEQNITATYTPLCRARFGDGRCGINADSYKVTGTVSTILDERNFTDSSRSETAGYFNKGLIKFATGQNAGFSTEVKIFEDKKITLSIPFPKPISIGDEYEVTAGCDKKFSTCISKFSNAINFRGEPQIPGIEQIFKTI